MDYMIYELLAPVTACFILLSIGISFRYRKEKISKLILLYQISVLLFLVSNYLEFLTNHHGLIVLSAQFQHFFLQCLSFSWFLFAINYTGYERILKKELLIIMGLIIVLNTVIIFTNNYHFLFWSEIAFVEKIGILKLDGKYGVFFWLISGFDYTFLIAGVVFIVTSYIRGGSLFRIQARLILVGFFIPFLSNIIYVFRIIPGFHKDFSSVAFAFTGLFLFISIYRFRLLHFSPLSRSILLNDLQEIIITLDSNYIIIDFNDIARSVFNLSEDSLGKRVHSTTVGVFIGELDRSKADQNELSMVKKYASFTYNIRIKKIFSESCKLKAILISMSDITDKMNLIDELRETNDKLKNMQLQLVNSERMALLGQVSAGIAHEINNPLSFIKSNYSVIGRYLAKIEQLCINENTDRAKLLHDSLDDIKEIVADSNDGVLRISEVVQNLLGFSRGNTGEKTTVYDLNQGIDSTLVLARNSIKYRAELEVISGDIPSFLTCGNEVNQVLLNLITNAVQSIPDNGSLGLIKIETFYDKGNVICEITDNGISISITEREQIFEPFYTSKRNSGGTGLGLSISRNIIEKEFSGRLFVKDSMAKTFRMEIPVHV